ncbi:adenylate cyclase [Pelomyxa schiedti]|nr:adenylate cyclase [Pelomyxa schiedti]
MRHSNKVGDAPEGGGATMGLSLGDSQSQTAGSSTLLVGIGAPIDDSRLMKKRMAGSCSIMVIVPVSAVLVVVIVLLACLVPMTSLWITSLKGLTSTCTSSLSYEMDVYRNLLVEKSVDSIAIQMRIPPLLVDAVKMAIPESSYTSSVLLHTDPSAFQLILRGMAKQFTSISNLMVAWVNNQGNHLYADMQTYWGVHDSAVNSNITYFWIRDGYPTTERRAERDLTNYNLTLRSWWKVGLNAWNGSWTSVYMSANPIEGRVMAYTIRPSISVPAVIQATYTLSYLQDFFFHFNLTTNGLAFLSEDRTLKIIAGSAGIPILTSSGGPIFATNCSNATIRAASGQWLNLTGQSYTEKHFLMETDEGPTYVDVVPISGDGGLTLWLFLITPEKDFMEAIQEEQSNAVDDAYLSLWVVLSIEICIGILSVAISVTLALILARALGNVIQKLRKVSSGNLNRTSSNTALKRSLLKEIDSLNSEVTIMQSALESFSQYVPTQVVSYLCRNHMKPVVGVARMHCTVMFLDVVDFTHNMEHYGAQVIIDILSTMFESFSTVITKNNGCIDKYIGDAIMALWGCPVKDPNSEMNACRAVAEMLTELSRLNMIFQAKSYPAMKFRIGLHSGEVSAGNVGSSHRLNYTVLGNTVNLAARLEPLNKELLTAVLVTDNIRSVSKSDPTFSWRALGHIQVRGFKRPVLVHEFLGFTSQLKPETKQILRDYAPIDAMLFNKDEEMHADEVTTAMAEYLELHPEDYTVTQAKESLVAPHSTTSSAGVNAGSNRRL